MTEDTCLPTHYGTREGPVLGAAVGFVACCGCLQFNQVCNTQYLGVA